MWCRHIPIAHTLGIHVANLISQGAAHGVRQDCPVLSLAALRQNVDTSRFLRPGIIGIGSVQHPVRMLLPAHKASLRMRCVPSFELIVAIGILPKKNEETLRCVPSFELIVAIGILTKKNEETQTKRWPYMLCKVHVAAGSHRFFKRLFQGPAPQMFRQHALPPHLQVHKTHTPNLGLTIYMRHGAHTNMRGGGGDTEAVPWSQKLKPQTSGADVCQV